MTGKALKSAIKAPSGENLLMSDAYWKAKIWGLLHDPALKALHNNSGRGGEGFWQELAIMQGWTSPKESGKKLLEWIATSDLITWQAIALQLATSPPQLTTPNGD